MLKSVTQNFRRGKVVDADPPPPTEEAAWFFFMLAGDCALYAIGFIVIWFVICF
jgi:hypothetical protein